MNENRKYSRQLDLITPKELNVPILIIGAGGIGSWAALALTKMGCTNITVIDHDVVDIENTPSQLYSDVGTYKVEALKKEILDKTGVLIHGIRSTFQSWVITQKPTAYEIVIFAVDSLLQRKEILTYMLSQQIYTKFLIDARMAGELIRILTVDTLKKEEFIEYAKTLDINKPAHEEPCTSKAVVYNTFLCGGLIASLVKKFVKKEIIKSNIIFDITNLQIF